MAKTFSKLTRAAMRGLPIDKTISEHGISFKRVVGGDGVFTVNIMVDGQRIHRVIGRESDGTTRTQAGDYIQHVREDARHHRLGLPKGRKAEMIFSEAANLYLREHGQTNGKDLEEKQRRLTLHLVPFFGRMPLSKIDALSIERYKKNRLDEPSLRGGVRRGATAASRPVASPTKLTSQATVNRELAVLSHLLSRALEWGWIAAKPAQIRRFQEQQTRFEYLTEAEIGSLLERSFDWICASATHRTVTFCAAMLVRALRMRRLVTVAETRLGTTRRVGRDRQASPCSAPEPERQGPRQRLYP
jgi:hypothetical protein